MISCSGRFFNGFAGFVSIFSKALHGQLYGKDTLFRRILLFYSDPLPILLEPSRRIKSSSVRCFRYRCTVAGDFPIASESLFIESFIRSFMGSFDAINLNRRKGCSFVKHPLTAPNVLYASVSAYFSLNHTSITGESFTFPASVLTNPPSSSE